MAYCVIAVCKVHELLPDVGNVSAAKIVGAPLILAALFAVPAGSFKALLRSAPMKWLAAVVVLAVLSVPFGLWAGGSFQFLSQVFWKSLLFCVIASAAWLDRRTLHLSLVALVSGTTVVALMLLLRVSQVAGARFYGGATHDPNETALLLLVFIPFAMYLASSAKGVAKGVWYVSALLMVGGIARTGSRGGFLGLLALVGWLVYRAAPRRRWRYVAGTLVAVAGFGLAIDAASLQRLATLTDPTADYNYTYREGRLEVWKRGLGYLAAHPLLGVGVENFEVAEGVISGKRNEGFGVKWSAAHNSFIEVGAELGLPGLVAFVGMLWAAAVGCRRVRAAASRGTMGAGLVPVREGNLADAGLGALVAWLVAGSFLSMAYDVTTLFIVAFCVAVWSGSPLANYQALRPLERRAPPTRAC